MITHGSSLPSGGGAPASTSDRTSSAVPREAEPVGRSLGLAPPSDAATTGVVSSASVATTDPSAPPLPRNENSAALRAPGNPLSVRPVVVPQSSPPPLRPSVATVTSPTTTRSRGGIPPTLSDQLFPPLSMDRQLDRNPVVGAESAAASGKAGVPKSSWVDLSLDQHPTPPAADAAMVVMEPAPSVFQTPSPDDAETAEERERRRRALALEQQRLILQQVEAARAARAAATQKKTLPPSPQQHPQKSVVRLHRIISFCPCAQQYAMDGLPWFSHGHLPFSPLSSPRIASCVAPPSERRMCRAPSSPKQRQCRPRSALR